MAIDSRRIPPTLPPPLEDPLRFAWLPFWASIAGGLLIATDFGGVYLVFLTYSWPVWLLMLLPVAVVLPVRPPRAFYLRAFSTDDRSTALITDVRRGIGRRFRLAGIRPPRQRTSTFLKHLAVAAFSYRYSSPRYMDLEAGDTDWLPRLWRTLRHARCVFLNVSELSGWVRTEVALCVALLGWPRIAWITNAEITPDLLQQRLVQELQLPVDTRCALHLIRRHTNSAESDPAFVAGISSFIDGLPPASTVDDGLAWQIVEAHLSDRVPRRGRRWIGFLAAVSGGLAVPGLVASTSWVVALVVFRWAHIEGDFDQNVALGEGLMPLIMYAAAAITALVSAALVLPSLGVFLRDTAREGRLKAILIASYYLVVLTALGAVVASFCAAWASR